MKTVAIVVRTLKQGKTYEDFRKAWYHTMGFGTQTKMYSLVNALNPREIITIGMVETELEDVPSLLKIDAGQRATHPLGEIIEESITRYFGILVAEDDFSAEGSLEYQPPEVDGKKTDLKDLAHVLEVIDMAVKGKK
jgi:hypothetical protein